MVTTRVYPDANIALHYRALEQLDWRAILQRDQVVVVITSVFLREIDLNKDSKRGHIQKRARRVNSWLSDVRKNKLTVMRPGISLEVNANEPEVDINLAEHGLTPSSHDDKFVACMLRDRLRHPNAEFVCVTADSTLSYKADAKGLVVIDLPDSYRVPPEPDEAELENRELRRQLLALQSRAEPEPRLRITSTGEESFSVFTLRVLEPITEETIEEHIQLKKSMIALNSSVLLGAFYSPPSKTAIDAYVERLAEWLRWYSDNAIAQGLTFRVKLVLRNDGNGNAEDVELRLTFPSAVLVAEERSYERGPTRPRMPRGRSVLDAHTLKLSSTVLAPSAVDLRNLFGREAYQPVQIRGSENPHELVIYVASIKNRSEVVLPEFDAWFLSAEQLPTRGLQVECHVHTGSPPDLQSCKIDMSVSFEQCSVAIPDEDPEFQDSDD